MAPSTRRPMPRSTPRKPMSNFARKDIKPNASILTFFKKVETEKGLFYSGSQPDAGTLEEDTRIPDADDDADDEDRFNESETSIKRRKRGSDQENQSANGTPSKPYSSLRTKSDSPTNGVTVVSGKTFGGFVIDSESEDEGSDEDAGAIPALPERPASDGHRPIEGEDRTELFKPKERSSEEALAKDVPTDDMDGVECYDDTDAPEDYLGEEFREMMFSQEQARLEAEDSGDFNPDDFPQLAPVDDVGENCCPICGGSLAGTTSDESTRHVNSCIDGNPTPLPSRAKPKPQAVESEAEPIPEARGRSAKAAIPRPAQADPFSRANGKTGNTAFSKLMSGNAESSAWATAAAAATAAHGKPAYQRTCPFYKIMPGFSICVDAFRYGAVKDCNAYFLSHFHSDHYIGLSRTWKHGPIYCSHVTGRLVKQQLRVAAQWVVELDFDVKFDIPGTDGASVTMIPANHCPGSSLFLFEKPTGKGPNSKVQRILHCGDFRACYAHVTHDLLRPNILDPVSKQLRQQKIDVCYLDTTYLNPRYNFPPQGEVIDACASLCVRISEDETVWDKLGRGNGNLSVSKFFKKPNSTTNDNPKNRLLVVCGTYSIGKERISVAIAKALKTKIYATPYKMRIFKALDDAEFLDLLTPDPLKAQVHMQSLGEIRADTLREYLGNYKSHFGRIIGFRPSGWNYKPRGALFAKLAASNTPPSAIATPQLLSKKWCPRFGVEDFERQRGSTAEAMCFGVPYSEHSSFRELCMFLMSLRIGRVIPTVNVGSEPSRRKMKSWIDKWISDRNKGGVVQVRQQPDGIDIPALQMWDGQGKKHEAWW